MGCDRTEIQPSEAPEVGQGEGLVAIVMTTHRTTLAVHYVSEDNEHQFSLAAVEPGTSIQVHRVPADVYCVRTVTWQAATFHADHRDSGRILCMEVKAGVLNYPGHLVFAGGKMTLARSGFKARYVETPADLEQRIHADYPKLVPLLDSDR